MMVRASLVSALLALAAACGGGGTPPTTTPTGAALSKGDAVIVAVLVHEIETYDARATSSLCITTRGADDTEAIFATIAARYPTAVKDSECSGGGPTGPVRDGAGNSAARFDVGPAAFLDDKTATCGGGGPHTGGGARDLQYRLERSGDSWKVVDEKVMMMT
jgi:hypothetical protein